MASYAEKVIRDSFKKTTQSKIKITNEGLMNIDRQIAQKLQENAKIRQESMSAAAGLPPKR